MFYCNQYRPFRNAFVHKMACTVFPSCWATTDAYGELQVGNSAHLSFSCLLSDDVSKEMMFGVLHFAIVHPQFLA